MNDTEKVMNFGEMVDAVNKVSSPWRKAFFAMLGFCLAAMIVMGGIIFYLVHCAYAEGSYLEQGQNYVEQEQHQVYGSGVAANGDTWGINGNE